MIKKYIKKPVVVEAVQWGGINQDEIRNFIGLSKENFIGVPLGAWAIKEEGWSKLFVRFISDEEFRETYEEVKE